MLLKAGDTVVFMGCSNGQQQSKENLFKLNRLKSLIEKRFKLKVEVLESVFLDQESKDTLSATVRARHLIDSLTNPRIKAVFDLTGGDLANELISVLTQQDIQKIIEEAVGFYVGYSDNTVILNSLLLAPNIIPINFHLPKIIEDETQTSLNAFEQVFFLGKQIGWDSLQPLYISKPAPITSPNLIGGNIRCFLKLAGTKFWPIIQENTLILEAYSGDLNKIRTYFAHLALTNLFEQVDSLIIGRFSEIEASQQKNQLISLVIDYAKRYHFSVYQSDFLGHHQIVYPFRMTTN